MIDTHCHLMDVKLSADKAQHIKEAHSVGVENMITLGTDLESSKEAIAIAEENQSVYAAVGVYPGEVNTDIKSWEKDIQTLSIMATSPHVVAIGETGLDMKYVYDISIDRQIENLLAHIHISLVLQKALVLHSRETSKELIETLQSNWSDALRYKIVFHCCEPLDVLLHFAINHDIFIGVDGDVTYNNDKIEFVKRIPLENLVIETDSPYLLPEPLRTQKAFPNSPKNLPVIAQKIAQIKNSTAQEIDLVTTHNAKILFSL